MSAHPVLRQEARASLIVFIAAWPSILGLQWLMGPVIGAWPPVWQAGALCAVMAPLLTFIVCPMLDRLLPGRPQPPSESQTTASN